MQAAEANTEIVSILRLQLPRSNRTCPACGESEAVFFQSQQRKEDTKMVCDFSSTNYHDDDEQVFTNAYEYVAASLLRLLLVRKDF